MKSTTRTPSATAGDVDRQGEIVDLARYRRIRAAIGEHRAADVDADAQAALVLDLLDEAAAYSVRADLLEERRGC